jgi:conjugal transfer pilus assembly protein TraI
MRERGRIDILGLADFHSQGELSLQDKLSRCHGCCQRLCLVKQSVFASLNGWQGRSIDVKNRAHQREAAAMSSFASLFSQWFPPSGKGVSNTAARRSLVRSQTGEAYPPAAPGLPAVSLEEVVAPHAGLLKRLHDAYGAEEDVFERDIVSVVKRYARFVHLLPATADSYFRGVGGLFRMGLEVGFYALQASDGVIFCGRQTITQRFALEPRWRYATFLAGLCGELHRVFTEFVVTSDRGREWPSYGLPLFLWLREEKANPYYVRWHPHPPEARALALVALARIGGRRILQYLAQGNAIVVPSLVAALSASAPREPNTIDQLLRRASALVIERDLCANVDRYGGSQLGGHLEHCLVDAMRRLAAQEKWVANARGSPLWYAADGMFLLWPRAATDLIAVLERDRLPGVPKGHETIAEVLAAAGVIESSADGCWLWEVLLPDAATASSALKLASPLLLACAARTTPAPLPRPLRQSAPDASPSHTVQAKLALPEPEQLPVTPIERSPPSEPHLGSRTPVTLDAPARLNPTVRDALNQIIATIDSPSRRLAASVIELGVFIPLKEFEQRNVDPALAVRALRDAGMLVSDPKRPGSKTHSRDFHDTPVLGLVLASRYVCGLDSAVGQDSALQRAATAS